MAILPILTAPDPRLKQVAKAVKVVNGDIVRLMDDMLETMYDAPGIGLAAPQVGASLRVLVIDIGRGEEDRQPIRMANPELIWVSDEDKSYEEGCLSVPEHYAQVVRPVAVRVRYLDEAGLSRDLDADGLLATVIQHEMDHLDGVLFIDHISALKRNMIMRKLAKEQRQVK